MDVRGSSLRWLLGAVVSITACQPKIGDQCLLHSDCATTGGRICLPNQSTDKVPNFPGGYCTIFNCNPGGCPSEAACVAYGTAPSTKPGCADPLVQRFERTFCLRNCSSGSDCRAGYACVDLSDPATNPWGAAVVENGAKPTTVCALPFSSMAPPGVEASAPVPGVCEPPADASFPLGPLSGPDGSFGPRRDAGAIDAAPPDAKVGP